MTNISQSQVFMDAQFEYLTNYWKVISSKKMASASDHLDYAIIRALYEPKHRHKTLNQKLEVAISYVFKSFHYDYNGNGWLKLRRAARFPSSFMVAFLGNFNQEIFKEYEYIKDRITYPDYNDPWFAYIFTRTDIPKVQIAIQTAHVMYDLGAHKYPDSYPRLHFCLLDGGNYAEFMGKLKKYASFVNTTFEEPDMNNEITSFVLSPMRRSWAKKNMPMLKEEKLLTID